MTDEIIQNIDEVTSEQRREEENETGEILQAQVPVEEMQQEFDALMKSLKEEEPAAKKPEKTEEKAKPAENEVPSRRAVIRAKAENASEREQRRRERAEFLSEWGSLQSAMHNGIYMEEVVAGVEEIPEYDEVFLSFFVKEKYRCLMPFSEIFREDMGIDMKTVDPSIRKGRDSLINRKKQMARKFIGVRIPFVITNMELDNIEYPEDHLILTSRKTALAIIEKINYEPKKKSPALIKEGNVETGTIVNLAANGMLINVGGVDTLMPLHQITHRFIFNLYQEDKYKPGHNIKVMVTSIKHDPKYGYMIEVNAKSIELLDAKKLSYKLPKNKKAEFNMIVTSGFMSPTTNAVMFNGWLERYDMPALAMFVPTGGIKDPIHPGRVVRVKIGKQRPDGKVECVVVRIEDFSVTR